MRKLLTFLIALTLLSTTVYAIEYFFQKSAGHWNVVGHPGSESLNPACIAATNWSDGSYLNLIQDLADGELHIEFKNNDWDVTDADLNAQYEMTINLYNRDKSSVQSWPGKFVFTSKNSIQIRGISAEAFLPGFMAYNKMVIIPPGTMPNAEVDLQNSTNAISLMTECMAVSKSRKPLQKPNQSLQQGV